MLTTYDVALTVIVRVKAPTPYVAERFAFENADTLRASRDAHVSQVLVLREQVGT